MKKMMMLCGYAVTADIIISGKLLLSSALCADTTEGISDFLKKIIEVDDKKQLTKNYFMLE